MREGDRQRHQLRRFIARVSEHHALIARTDPVILILRSVLRLIGLINTHSNIGRLHVD